MTRAVLLLMLIACRRDLASTESTPTAPTALPSSLPAPSATPAASSTSAAYGPLATADRSQREAAVLDLVLGGDAGALPERATDPGKSFEPGLRDRIAPAPGAATNVRQNRLVVSDPAALPPQVVTRILRQQYGRLRFCYQQGALKQPGLEGDVVVAFTVDSTGAVVGAKNDNSTLAEPETIACMVRAVGSALFPKPGNGEMSIVYGVHVAPTL